MKIYWFLSYQKSKSIEGLADLQEVMSAVDAARGSSIEEVEKTLVRKKKNAADLRNGSCWKRLLSREIEEHEISDKSLLLND